MSGIQGAISPLKSGHHSNSFYVPNVLSLKSGHHSNQDTLSKVSQYSTTSMFSHPVPESPPASLTIFQVSNSTISLSWEPVSCPERNAPLTGYRVAYGTADTFPENQLESDVLRERTFVLQDLRPNTTYSFQVFPVVGLEEMQNEEVPRTGLVSLRTQVLLLAFPFLIVGPLKTVSEITALRDNP